MAYKNNKFHFPKPFRDENGFFQIPFLKNAYDLESLNNKIQGIIIEEMNYTEENYPFTITANFSTLGSIIGVSTQSPVVSNVPDASIRDLSGFNATTI